MTNIYFFDKIIMRIEGLKMQKEVKVTYKEKVESGVLVGTTLKELSDRHTRDYKYDILISKVDNDIVELSDTITKKCNVEFYDRSSTLGHSVYSASANFILILAVRNVLGENAKIVFEHSLDNGVFCSIENSNVTKSVVKKIEDEMHKIVEANYNFEKYSVSRTTKKRIQCLCWKSKL